MNEINRRQFVVAAGVAACGCAIGSAELLAAPSADATVDAGALADLARVPITDTFAKSHKFFILKLDDRLVASASECTHKRCVLKPRDSELYCSCHGSLFTLEGQVTKGPAKQPLTRFAISTNDAGRVLVDLSRTFAHDQFEDPASFIRLNEKA